MYNTLYEVDSNFSIFLGGFMVRHLNKLNLIDSSDSFFKTIGDVSAELNIPPHVLRFWESKFSDIKPLKRKGGHRYYRPEDIEIISRIKDLLHNQGFTIKGAQKFLRKSKKKESTKVDNSSGAVGQVNLFSKEVDSSGNSFEPEKVQSFIKELESVKDMLNSN